MQTFTTADVLRELGAVVASSEARAMLSRAARVARVHRDVPLATSDLLVLLEALAAEGGVVQILAEDLAQEALRP